MREPKINLETEYLLLHEILSVLRRKGTNINTDTREYEFEIAASHLPYKTLVITMNNPMRYDTKKTKKQGIIEFAPKGPTPIEDIVNTRFSEIEVALAVETLEGNNDIIRIKNPIPINIHPGEIALTEVGLNCLNNKLYLKQYFKEKHEQRAYRSSIVTNGWMVALTFILAIGAVVEIVKFFKRM